MSVCVAVYSVSIGIAIQIAMAVIEVVARLIEAAVFESLAQFV